MVGLGGNTADGHLCVEEKLVNAFIAEHPLWQKEKFIQSEDELVFGQKIQYNVCKVLSLVITIINYRFQPILFKYIVCCIHGVFAIVAFLIIT
jgi:hypothetical protein